MKQLELSLTERLAFANILSAQKAENQGAKRLRPFSRVAKKIRLDDEEKVTLVYQEFQVPSKDGRMLMQSVWDSKIAASFPSKAFLIENADAEACAVLLKSDSLDITTGDIEWLDVVLTQLESKDVAVAVAPAAA